MGSTPVHADSVERAAGWHWNSAALERLVEDDGDAAASATGRSSYLGNRISFRRRETSSLSVCHVSVSASTSSDRSRTSSSTASVLLRSDWTLSQPMEIAWSADWPIPRTGRRAPCCVDLWSGSAGWRYLAGRHRWNVNKVLRTDRGGGRVSPASARSSAAV